MAEEEANGPSPPDSLHGKHGEKNGVAANGHDGGAEEVFATSESALLRKIDMRLIPALSIMYLLAFLDRTNIANAAVYGLVKDLNIVASSNDYNTALTLFFVPYVVFEIPSNIALKRFKPHVWLPSCMFLFGLVTVLQGLVKDKGGLYATRFVLGLLETGMFPGSFYLIGMWYRRAEAQKRFTFFFASTSLAGAFGGLIAAGINNINGARGMLAWRWIFIIEGTITMFFAPVLFFWIPDFPESARFLREDEKRQVVKRLEADQGTQSGLERRIQVADVIRCFKDWKLVIGGFMYFGLIVPAYAYAFFAPGIISAFGYTPVQTQLHSVPPWAAAWGWSLLLAYVSDRFKRRFPFICLSIGLAIVGFAVLLSHAPSSAKYAALHLVTSGVYGAMPIIVCWFNLNLGGHHRRAIGSAWQIGFGNIGGIIATYAFLAKDKPTYVPGYSICLGMICLSLLACTAYLVGVIQANRKKRAAAAVPSVDEHEEAGDLAADYRYMY